LASMRSHFFSTSAVLVEWVLPNMKQNSVHASAVHRCGEPVRGGLIEGNQATGQ
jgi:hypothetical protein